MQLIDVANIAVHTHVMRQVPASGHSHFGQNKQEDFAFVICSAKSSCNYIPCLFCKSFKPTPYHVAPLLVSLVFQMCVRLNKEIRDRFLNWSQPNFSYELSMC